MFQSTRPGRSATPSCAKFSLTISGFNPRAPGGARLAGAWKVPAACIVSIHAPRAERDSPTIHGQTPTLSFNPRAPGGARPFADLLRLCSEVFQSTRPGRSATWSHTVITTGQPVSIHAPRAERDVADRQRKLCCMGFNPRAPGGARLPRISRSYTDCGVSIHAPRAERDGGFKIVNAGTGVSIHAPRAERDLLTRE